MISSDEVRGLVKNAGDVVLSLRGNEPIIAKSGDALFDQALANTLLKLTNTFGVLPDFGYVQEWERDGQGRVISNAVAIPPSMRPPRNPDGTVLFGKLLLAALRAEREHPEVAVTAVCAHEWGHIVQFKKNLFPRLRQNSPTGKPIELHADFLAGYFSGIRKREKPDYPAAVVALTQYRLGDGFVSDPDHHGTQQERGAAVVAGFEAGYTNRKSFAEAVEIGITFARSKI